MRKYEQEIALLEEAAHLANHEMKTLCENFHIEDKMKGRDVVTDIDKKIELAVLKMIKSRFPNDTIISEEFLAKNQCAYKQGRCFIIDPLDGTWNFSNYLENYGFQMAFLVDGEVEASIIELPFSHSGETFLAVHGMGATLNGQKIVNIPRKNIHQSLISIGDISLWNRNAVKDELTFVDNLNAHNVGLFRIFGSSAFSFAMLAVSRVDAYVTYFQKIWDVAAGLLLVRECGCLVINDKCEEYSLGEKNVYAISSGKELQKIIVGLLHEK